MTATAPQQMTRHPAKFHSDIVRALVEILAPEVERVGHGGEPLWVLDPFAGTGRVHSIAESFEDDEVETIGVELELEWAKYHERTRVANALDMADMFEPCSFDAIVTSPCYGNRMADSHEAKDACKTCGGSGHVHDADNDDDAGCIDPYSCERNPKRCPTCKGEGLSRRNTYRHALGRPLSDGSAAGMQWGNEYRQFHSRVWSICWGLLAPGGVVCVNVKNHERAPAVGKPAIEQRVVEYHMNAWLMLGATIQEVRRLPLGGLKQGANWKARTEAELILVLRKPSHLPSEGVLL